MHRPTSIVIPLAALRAARPGMTIEFDSDRTKFALTFGIDPRSRIRIEQQRQQPFQHLQSLPYQPSGSVAGPWSVPSSSPQSHSSIFSLRVRRSDRRSVLDRRRKAAGTDASACQPPLGSMIGPTGRQPFGSIPQPASMPSSDKIHLSISASNGVDEGARGAAAVGVDAAAVVEPEQRQNPPDHFNLHVRHAGRCPGPRRRRRYGISNATFQPPFGSRPAPRSPSGPCPPPWSSPRSNRNDFHMPASVSRRDRHRSRCRFP
jgi:hypothetical protein